MKLPVDIGALLRGKTVEWERLEFKRGWNPEAVVHTLCAFANDFHNLGGGYVIVGVEEENGRPILPPKGIDPATIDDIQKELLRLGHIAIQPNYHPVSVPYEIDGKSILVIWAPGGETRPYKAKKSLGKDENEYAWYIRKGSNTVRAKDQDEQELLGLAATVPFDDRINRRASVEDLSRDLIVDFLAEIGSELADEAEEVPLIELGRQMQIVAGADEAVFPRNVGLMFFNDEPQRFFPVTQIDVVWFPEGPGGDVFTEKVFKGPLHHIIRDALDYIERSFLTETVIKHPDRAEATRVANFPFDAIEEAVVNAVYHRSYEIREPVEVRIGREDLAVLSYPGPDRSVKLDRLRQGRALSRRYRNRRIGEFLKELELTEGRGTGIPKILKAMRENGSPEPVFEFDEDHSYFQVVLPIQQDALIQVIEQPTVQVTDQVTDQVSEEVARLISVVEREMKRKEMQDALGLRHRGHFKDAYLDPAMELGLIEMTRPDTPRSSKQRYRLTEKGRVWKQAHNGS